MTSILNEDTHNKQSSAEQINYYQENFCQSTYHQNTCFAIGSTDQSIYDNNFNDDISQNCCQEITSLDYFQYNNNCFLRFPKCY